MEVCLHDQLSAETQIYYLHDEDSHRTSGRSLQSTTKLIYVHKKIHQQQYKGLS